MVDTGSKPPTVLTGTHVGIGDDKRSAVEIRHAAQELPKVEPEPAPKEQPEQEATADDRPKKKKRRDH